MSIVTTQNPTLFASDNAATVHPAIMEALLSANQGHAPSYGNDSHTQEAIERFKTMFGRETEAFFVYNGTAANTLGISAITKPYHSIICADVSHLNEDECGAPEKYTGCKLLTVPSANGKLTVPQIDRFLGNFGIEHRSQPKVISITQNTEYGVAYRPEEIRELADFAHKNSMFLHMDGARLANAAVFLGMDFRGFTKDCGVDVLSFGASKNGLMFGEAILFFNPDHATDFKYIRKQGMQLQSKMRYISAQLNAYLANNLWHSNASHANQMAGRLADGIAHLPGVHLTQAVEGNAVFAQLPQQAIATMQEKAFFYVWNASKNEVRLMLAFDTPPAAVDAFISNLADCLKKIL